MLALLNVVLALGHSPLRTPHADLYTARAVTSRHASVQPRCGAALDDLSTSVPQRSRTTKAPVFNEVCEQTGITLSRYMCEVGRANPNLRDLETLVSSIQTACKTIGSLVARAHISGTVGAHGSGGSINIQGEEQKKLDVITNDVLKKALRFTGKMGVIASEEEDIPLDVESDEQIPMYDFAPILDETSRYIAVFDPLDGSSNVDAGIPTGTIFGIFEQNDEECVICDDDFDECDPAQSERAMRCLQSTLQPGSNLVASGYCLYSSSTFFCLTLGAGVNIFTLDPNIGEFILTHPNVKIPQRGNIYSLNEANRQQWDLPMQEYVSALQRGEGQSGTRYTSRYIGSMVGDVHRTLIYGGLFAYPADSKNPDGKLRLLYEAAPMAFLIEQAGGLALTGKTRVMDLLPKSVHQRVPLVLGSRDDVLECRSFYESFSDEALTKRCLSRLSPGQRLDDSMDNTHDAVAVDVDGDGLVDRIERREFDR